MCCKKHGSLSTPTASRKLALRFHDIIDPAPGRYAPSRDDVARLLAFGRELSEPEACHLLVHCHAGVGRAPLTAAAYLIRDGRSAADVMAFLKSARPIIGLNDRQFERLREWHELYHRERASG